MSKVKRDQLLGNAFLTVCLAIPELRLASTRGFDEYLELMEKKKAQFVDFMLRAIEESDDE